MAQEFNVQFPTRGSGGLPQPFAQSKKISEKIIGAAQLRQARLNEKRRRLERAQTIDRQDLKTAYGYDQGQLADSFRSLFQQDVEEARDFILNSDDIAAQQAKLAELQSTFTWMSEHNNETVQMARKAMGNVAFSDPSGQRAASANLDVGMEFDESPEHFAEVEMQFNNFFDPSKAVKKNGVWMVEQDGVFKDVRELEGYANAGVFSPRTKSYDLGTVSEWATDSATQRIVKLDGSYSEERAKQLYVEQATVNNKNGKEHRAQILASLHQRDQSPFTDSSQERAFIEGVPMSKDDEGFARAQKEALDYGEQMFLAAARTEPTPDQKDINKERFMNSGQQTQFSDDSGFNHQGTVRSLTGFSDMIIQDEFGSAIKVTPSSVFVDDNNQVYLKYASMSETGDQMSHTVPLQGEQLAEIDLQMRSKHNVSISDLYTEKKQGKTGVGSLDDIGVTIPDTPSILDTPSQKSTVEFQDTPEAQQEAFGQAMESVPQAPADNREIISGLRLPADSPLITMDSTTGKPTGRSGVLEKIVANQEGEGDLGMNSQQVSEFFSIPSVNNRLKELGIEQLGVGQDRPLLGGALETVFGGLGYKTAVTKNAEKVMEFLNSDEGVEMKRKYLLMGAPGDSTGAMDAYPTRETATPEMPGSFGQMPQREVTAQAAPVVQAPAVRRMGSVAPGSLTQGQDFMVKGLVGQGASEPVATAITSVTQKESKGKHDNVEKSYEKTSPARIREIFSRARDLNNREINRLKKNPEQFFEFVYGGRMGNDQPGDGYKFRGRGLIQLTGKDNYADASRALYGDDTLISNPDLITQNPQVAAQVANWYLMSRGLQRLVPADTLANPNPSEAEIQQILDATYALVAGVSPDQVQDRPLYDQGMGTMKSWLGGEQ